MVLPVTTKAAQAQPTTATASPVDTSVRTGIVTGYAGLCLDDANARAVNNNQITIFTCNGSDAQQWTIIGAGHTVEVFGMCLDLRDGSTASGTTIVLYQCDQAASQVFVPEADGALYNPLSNMCIEDPGSSTTPRTVLDIGGCTGGANQSWVLPD